MTQKTNPRVYVLPALAMAMLAFSVYHLVFAAERMSEYDPVVSPPAAAFKSKISATGIVEAKSENISIGTAVSGVVSEVLVPSDQVGKNVAAGTPLFRVDDRHLQAQLLVQQASLRSAEAQLSRLEKMPRPEEVPISDAKVLAAGAARRRAEDQAKRLVRLKDTEAVSESDVIAAQAQFDEANQELVRAEAEAALLKAGAWEEDKSVAAAAVQMAQAQVEQTKTEIERCIVRAPVAGVILKVAVRPGEYVMAASGQTLIVMGNLEQKHIRVSVDEQDVPRFRPDAPAMGLARGDSRAPVPLRLVRVEPLVVPKKSFTGENTERLDTRVLEVIYVIESENATTYVGQQFDVFISVPEDSPAPLQET